MSDSRSRRRSPDTDTGNRRSTSRPTSEPSSRPASASGQGPAAGRQDAAPDSRRRETSPESQSRERRGVPARPSFQPASELASELPVPKLDQPGKRCDISDSRNKVDGHWDKEDGYGPRSSQGSLNTSATRQRPSIGSGGVLDHNGLWALSSRLGRNTGNLRPGVRSASRGGPSNQSTSSAAAGSGQTPGPHYHGTGPVMFNLEGSDDGHLRATPARQPTPAASRQSRDVSPARASWPLRFTFGRLTEFQLLPSNLWTVILGADSDQRGFQTILNGEPVVRYVSMRRPGRAFTEQELQTRGFEAVAIDRQGIPLTAGNTQVPDSYRLREPANMGPARPTSRVNSGPSGSFASPQGARTPPRRTSTIPNAGVGSASQESGVRGRGTYARSGAARNRSASTHSNDSVWRPEFRLGRGTDLTLGEWGAWLVTPADGTEPILLMWDRAPARPMSAAVLGQRAFSRDDLLSGRFSVEAVGSRSNGRPAYYALREDQRASSPGLPMNASTQGRIGTSSSSTNARRRSAQSPSPSPSRRPN